MIPQRADGDRLPDLLGPHMRCVFCGSAAGTASAAAKAYYAGPGNKFWHILYATGLTPERLQPHEFARLTTWQLGLTDLAKQYAGADTGLKRADDDAEALRRRITQAAPLWLAFNGKRAAAAFLKRKVSYGVQAETLDRSRIYVLPSTSGAAQRYWDAAPWHDLAQKLRATN